MRAWFGPAKSVAVCAWLLLVPACTSQNQPAAVSSEPANVGDAKLAAVAYHDSGAYERDLAAAAAPAIEWLTQRAPTATRR